MLSMSQLPAVLSSSVKAMIFTLPAQKLASGGIPGHSSRLHAVKAPLVSEPEAERDVVLGAFAKERRNVVDRNRAKREVTGHLHVQATTQLHGE